MLFANLNGWRILADPHFVTALSKLLNEVERKKIKSPKDFESSFEAKKLAAIRRIVLEEISQDPNHPKFFLGKTLGSKFASWRRAKFLGQYRLFFRFDSKAKVIILSWFSDEDNLRKYGSKTDSYVTFLKMLDKKKPPTNWVELLNSVGLSE